ncbi:MAG TPA: FecR domain-containing protein [Rhodothermales bacterium]|nr:FecR domain-containing protein [Rhodothermales bacterium]
MIHEWIRQKPAPLATDLSALWELSVHATHALPNPDPHRMETIWNKMAPRTTPEIVRIHPIRRYWPYGVAATIAILVSVLAFWQPSDVIPEPTRVLAQNAEQKTIQLPDGSEVFLNSGSVLEIASDFGEQSRTVQLIGEGFFSVTKSNKPFIVQTFNAQILVMGTKFNVRVRPDDIEPATSVFLEEGKVAFSNHNRSNEVILAPGESSEMTTSKPDTPRKKAKADALAWQTYRLAFTNEPIGHITNELSRRFNVPIHVPPAIQKKRHTLLLGRREDVESVLNDLCNSAGLRYRPTKDGYELISE